MQMTGSHTNDFQRGSLKGKWVVMLMKTYFELQNLRCRLLRSSGRTLVSERKLGPREVRELKPGLTPTVELLYIPGSHWRQDLVCIQVKITNLIVTHVCLSFYLITKIKLFTQKRA